MQEEHQQRSSGGEQGPHTVDIYALRSCPEEGDVPRSEQQLFRPKEQHIHRVRSAESCRQVGTGLDFIW